MARTRSQTRTVSLAPYRAPAPIIRVSTPRAPSAPKKRRSSRRSGGGGGSFGGSGIGGIVVGAGMLGMLAKSGTLAAVPALPIVGRTGTIAIAAYFWAKHGGGQLARNIMLAAASVAAYSYGKDGKIDGDDVMGPL